MGDKETKQYLYELCDYIDEHSDCIYVREQDSDGKWGSHSLAQLPGHKAISHAMRFIKQGNIPVRVLREEETNETS